jgi:hypothetical protein
MIGLLWQAVAAGSLGVVPLILAAAVAPAVLMWSCRRGEKYIAERCIRRYLLQKAKPAPTGRGG